MNTPYYFIGETNKNISIGSDEYWPVYFKSDSNNETSVGWFRAKSRSKREMNSLLDQVNQVLQLQKEGA